MENASLTLMNSEITNNAAEALGGGILQFVDGNVTSTPTISNTLVADNSTSGNGGGLYAENLSGGGNQSITIDESTFMNNQARGTANFTGFGGGLYIHDAEVLIDATAIISNTADSTGSPGGGGGGLILWNGVASVVNSTISGNHATGDTSPDNGAGGGLAMIALPGANVYFTFINTTMTNNFADEAGRGVWAGEPLGGYCRHNVRYHFKLSFQQYSTIY